MLTTFCTIDVGSTFKLNGNVYVKRSTRTGRIISGYNKTFYIGQQEVVEVQDQAPSNTSPAYYDFEGGSMRNGLGQSFSETCVL